MIQEGTMDLLLSRFMPVGISDMEHANLQDRRESKYLLTLRQAEDLISQLPDSYRVFEVDGRRIQTYSTMYYDSPGLDLYLDHHNGRKPRYKVRSRSYVGSDLNFLEVKEKKNTGRTVKHRIRTENVVTRFGSDLKEFLASCLPYDSSQYMPVLINTYHRITLVSAIGPERITLDINLKYHSDRVDILLPGIVIAELKRSTVHTLSPALDCLNQMRVRPKGFSKYCIGISLIYGDIVRYNNFRITLRYMDRLIQGGPVRC
jgi:hypothetical protein